jgi:hypothetical protein
VRTIAGILLSWFLAVSASLHGQEQPNSANTPPVINTDRPAITDSSTVVPKGTLLFENGFTETGSQRQESFDVPETLTRFGLTAKTELRFGAPDYFGTFTTGNAFGSGTGDLSLGVKQQLVATPAGFDASLVVSMSFPTGAKAVSSHGYDPQLQMPWSHPLSKNWTAAGMFSLLWPTQGASRNLTGQSSFLLDRQITSRWDAFVEYGGSFVQRGGPQHLVHTGTSLKLTPNQQLDFHCGFGLSSAAVGHFIGFGYSFQLQAIRRVKRDRS